MRFVRETILLVVGAALVAGCVPYSMKRTPKVMKPSDLPEMEHPPSIRLKLTDTTDHPKMVVQALERAKLKLPYLSAASDRVVDPDYTIELSVSHISQNRNTTLSSWTFMLVPFFFSDEVSVVARVEDAESDVLGSFKSKQKNKYFAQLHMLYLLPITAPLSYAAGQKIWVRTMRDALVQAGAVIAATWHPDVGAAPPPATPLALTPDRIPGVLEAYPGPRRPDGELATVDLVNTDWVAVGDVRAHRKSHRQIKLLPGEHHVEWGKTFAVSVLVNPEMQDSQVRHDTVTLQAGHTYAVHADRSYGHGYRVFLWIEDAATGEVIAGERKLAR